MHPELWQAWVGCFGDQVGAQAVVLGQIGREVRLLPIEQLGNGLLFGVARPEPKLSQVPSPDKVDLAI